MKQKSEIKICNCGQTLKFSYELQAKADKGGVDAGHNFILDGWYCPVCDY